MFMFLFNLNVILLTNPHYLLFYFTLIDVWCVLQSYLLGWHLLSSHLNKNSHITCPKQLFKKYCGIIFNSIFKFFVSLLWLQLTINTTSFLRIALAVSSWRQTRSKRSDWWRNCDVTRAQATFSVQEKSISEYIDGLVLLVTRINLSSIH